MTPDEREALKQSVKDDLEVRETVKEAEREWKQEQGKTVGQRLQKTGKSLNRNVLKPMGDVYDSIWEKMYPFAIFIAVASVIAFIVGMARSCQGEP